MLYNACALQERQNNNKTELAYREHSPGALTNLDLHISEDSLRSLEREGLGCQPRHSLHNLIPELQQRLWVLQSLEVFSWYCQNDVVCSQFSPGAHVTLDIALPLLQ